MATCASAMGGSGGAMAAAAAAGAKRECVCVCKICYAKMADYTVRITGWALKKKSQFYRALNHYLGSLQSLKHTCHLRIRLGGFCRSRKLRKNRRNASVFASEFFSKAKPGESENFLATNASWWSILYLNCWLCGGLMSAGGGGCWAVGLRVCHSGLQYGRTLNIQANKLGKS